MENENIIRLLKESEYHIDPLGRLILDDPALLALIQGTLGVPNIDDVLSNVGCSNAGC